MPKDPTSSSPAPESWMTPASIYGAVADALRWGALEMLQLGETAAAEDLNETALAARRNELRRRGLRPGAD